MSSRREGSRPDLDLSGSMMLAFALAFVIWLSAYSQARPLGNVRIPQDATERITVEYRGLPQGLAVYRPDQRNVKVELRGIQEQLDEFTAEDLEAFVDLSDISELGAASVPIQARCTSRLKCLRAGVTVRGARPETLGLFVGRAVTATREVKVDLAARVAPGFLIIRNDPQPATATIVGAEEVVSRTSHVEARVAFEGELRRSRSFGESVLVAVDGSGAVLEDVEVVPKTSEVAVRVIRIGQSAFVKRNIVGEVATGYEIDAILVEPDFVTLSGARDLVEGLRGDLEPIDIVVSDLSDDLVETLPVIVPDGVIATPEMVTVTVRVRPVEQSADIEALLSPQGLAEGYVAKLIPDRVRLLLKGPLPAIEALDPEEIRVIVDLEGLNPGAHRVTPRLDPPIAGITLRSVTPEEVQVEIERSNPSTVPSSGSSAPASSGGARTPIPARP